MSAPLTEAECNRLTNFLEFYIRGDESISGLVEEVAGIKAAAATKARAEGLTEAADEMEVTAKPGSIPWSDWLRDRAARIDRGNA